VCIHREGVSKEILGPLMHNFFRTNIQILTQENLNKLKRKLTKELVEAYMQNSTIWEIPSLA